jgi:hypothetical protein
LTICLFCGKTFEQKPTGYQRQTCSEECRFALVARKNRHGKPPKVKKPPRPQKRPKSPKPPRPEPQRKLKEKKTIRSSFTDEELGIVFNIFQKVRSFPTCRCEHPEKTMLFSLLGSSVYASCSVCGFSATSVSGSW